GKIDELKDARTGGPAREWTVAFKACLGDDDDLAVLDLPNEFCAHDVEGAGFRSEDKGIVELADNERSDADWVAGADHHVVGEADQGVGAFDLADSVDEAFDDAAFVGAGEKVEDDLAVGGRLADSAG